MTLSILHRVTGNGLATVGAAGTVWWLAAAATGADAYAFFLSQATAWYGYVVMIGLTWLFFEHLFSGLRHLVLDMGAGYELKMNKSWSLLIPFLSVFATAAFWFTILGSKL